MTQKNIIYSMAPLILPQLWYWKSYGNSILFAVLNDVAAAVPRLLATFSICTVLVCAINHLDCFIGYNCVVLFELCELLDLLDLESDQQAICLKGLFQRDF